MPSQKYAGGLIVEDWNNKPFDPKTFYALGWLSILGGGPSAEDIARCTATFIRNGFTRDRALLAIGRTQGMQK